MRASPPLKARLLFDDAYRPQPSPILGARSRTEPLLQRDTWSVPLTYEERTGLVSGGPADGMRPGCPSLGTLCTRAFSPCLSRTGYLRRMESNFGLPFLVILTSAYFGIKGMLVQIVGLVKLPYYMQAGIGPRAYQRYDIVTKAPWAIKALFGALSDLYPLFGYSKRSYMTIVSLVGGVSCVMLAVGTSGAPGVSEAISSVPAVTLYFLGVNLQAAVVDLLAEGRYTAAMAAAPWSGSDVVSWVWACVQAGQFVSAALVGWAADSHALGVLFPLAAVLALQILPFSEAGALGDTLVPPEARGFQRAKFDENPRVFMLAALMALAGIGIGACNLFDVSNTVLLVASLGSSVLLCALAFWALPRTLAKANLYLYLCSVLYVQISGAVDYFYVADSDCIPDGPHFSFRYYVTYSAVVQSLFGYLGVMLFQSFMRKWHFRAVLGFTVVLEVFAGAVDLVIVKRWNMTVLGVPDEVMYMLGYNIVFQVAAMLNFMPSVILTSKLCPPQMESTMFALLAGFQNFGSMVAGSLGVVLIQMLGIVTAADNTAFPSQPEALSPPPSPPPWHSHHPANSSLPNFVLAANAADQISATASPCDFSKLPYAIFLAHMVLPLLSVPLAYLLLPDARLTDEIRMEDDGVHHLPRKPPLRPLAPVAL